MLHANEQNVLYNPQRNKVTNLSSNCQCALKNWSHLCGYGCNLRARKQVCFLVLSPMVSLQMDFFFLQESILHFDLLLVIKHPAWDFRAVHGSSPQSALVYLCRKTSSGDTLLSKHYKPFIQPLLILSLDDRYTSYATLPSLLSLKLQYHIFHFSQPYLASFQTFSDIPQPSICSPYKLYLSLVGTFMQSLVIKESCI